MAVAKEFQGRILHLGSESIELQEWKVERLADFTFEYHCYVGHNFAKNGMLNSSKGAVWMLMRLTDPGQISETMEYRMGRTGLPGSGNDNLQDEWDYKATATFYRYDEILPTFFSGGTL
jgi:hypothetical protein